MIYYLIFSSGDLQPWAEEKHQTILPNVPPAASTSDLGSEYFSDDEKEDLLSKSVRIERTPYYDEDELATHSWFMNTI